MARWDPGTEDRLRRAALELYGKHGYDNVTITQIAERAGITRRSYFRYFPDKREVLFAGSDRLAPMIKEAVLAAPKSAPPLTATLGAVAEIGSLLVEQLDQVAERRAVIAASEELQERERTKFAAITTAIEEALRQRGTDPAGARMSAQLATVAFRNAFDRWVESGGAEDFPDCLNSVTESLRRLVSGNSS